MTEEHNGEERILKDTLGYRMGFDWGTPENSKSISGSEDTSDSESWLRKRTSNTQPILKSPK